MFQATLNLYAYQTVPLPIWGSLLGGQLDGSVSNQEPINILILTIPFKITSNFTLIEAERKPQQIRRNNVKVTEMTTRTGTDPSQSCSSQKQRAHPLYLNDSRFSQKCTSTPNGSRCCVTSKNLQSPVSSGRCLLFRQKLPNPQCPQSKLYKRILRRS